VLDCPRDLRDLYYIPNKELEGAISQWKQCGKVCNKCGYCKRLAEKIIKVYSTENGENILKPLKVEGGQ
jgi:hypothetical protein